MNREEAVALAVAVDFFLPLLALLQLFFTRSLEKELVQKALNLKFLNNKVIELLLKNQCFYWIESKTSLTGGERKKWFALSL